METEGAGENKGEEGEGVRVRREVEDGVSKGAPNRVHTQYKITRDSDLS